MEGVPKPVNHEAKKSHARVVRGENKVVRVVSSQKHKYRAESKATRDLDGNSQSNDKKGKQSEPSGRVLGDSKTSIENSTYCTTGSTDIGPNLVEPSYSRAKKSSPVPAGILKQPETVKVEKIVSKSKEENETVEKKSIFQHQGPSENCLEPKQEHTQELDAEPAEADQKPSATDGALNKTLETSSHLESNLDTRMASEELTLADQELGLKQAEERLERDYIYRLEKKSPEYSNCQYLCKLCTVHIENVQGAHKHIKEKRHKKNILEKQEEDELRALPPPTPAQISALGLALMDAAKENGVSQEDFLLRLEIVKSMETIIQMKLPECSLKMYGSSLTRFAFKSSDINIDVKFPRKMNQPDVLIQVLDILKNCACYTEVESDFHAKVPVVFCKDKKSGLTCKVSAGNDTACLTTEFLEAVGKLEPVLIPLVLAFRYWARLCHIDCQAEGGIPSYCFALMVVFFLQKRQPPTLPAYLGPWIDGFESKKLDEYHLKSVSDECYIDWEYRPSCNNENKGSSATDGRGRTEQNHRKTTLSELESRKNKERQGRSALVFDHPPKESLGNLWLELLKFYTLEFAMEEHVISVRVQGLLTRDNKNWPRRRIAIEDPFALKRNVARSLNSQMVYEYILERFRAAYRYFACPQCKEQKKSKTDARKRSKCINNTLSNPEDDEDNDSLPDAGSILTAEEFLEIDARLPPSQEEDVGTIQNNVEDIDKSNPLTEFGELDLSSVDERHHAVELLRSEENTNCNGKDYLAIKELTDTTEERCNAEATQLLDNWSVDCTFATSLDHETLKHEGSLSEEDLHYVFDKFILTSGKPPTIVCSFCKRDGHAKDDCPEDFKKIDLKPLPPMTTRFREILDRVCKRCYDELSPNACEQQNREQILAYLERFIRKEFINHARLCLFGSSKNGFGFRDSDLDICMTLEGHENAKKLNCKEIIDGLAKVLKRHPGLRNILAITTAKVPIVKFEHKESGVEGDISLYNTLAQHNTRMLATYAAIDPRVKYLGYTVKFFAKRCDIGDASRGSLSSYAYILMVLYFLQQRNPPVIPVLQEIYDGQETPQRMVDGWNAFFFDNTEELRNRFPSLGKNKESVGELWLGFLRFYTEEFDFKEYVISIRQKKLLTTFEKQWTSKCIAIEDPFDLNHNLGAGVSRKMTNFIMKAFINGRKLFGIPIYPIPGLEREYFFNSKVLTDGELAPNDRCCRVCGKIGHYMKDCPKRRRIKKKENEKDDDKDIKEDERDPREKRCFTCGDVGHVRRDCPEHNPVRQKNGGIIAPQILQGLILPQSVLTPLQQIERPCRTRQASESSESHHSSYSPQPQNLQQNSINQTLPLQTKLDQQQTPAAQNPHQVQRPMFNFPHSPPTRFSPLHNLGIFPFPPQIPLPSSSWPIRAQMLLSSSGNPSHPGGVTFPARSGSSSSPSTTNQSAVNLNDPSIIFAQPAARSLGFPNSTHDGPWHSSQTPSSLMSNGTVGGTDQGFQGHFAKPSTPWEHTTPPHFPLLPPSWPYRLPQNLLPQGPASFHSKTYYPPAASLIQNGPQFPVLSQGHPHLNSNYIQQKK